jgi:hypothetical protein
MVLTVQRTPEIKSNTANEGTRSELAMQQSADTIKRDVRLQDQSVMQTNKTEQNNVDRDGRGNSGYARGQGKGKKKPSQETRKMAAEYSGRLDVSV